MKSLRIKSLCHFFIATFFILNLGILQAQVKHSAISTTLRASERARSGIAHGGIGTGSFELRADGNFYNWTILNNYPFGTGPSLKFQTLPGKDLTDDILFFVVRYEVEGEEPKLKLLKMQDGQFEAGLDGIIYYYPWMEAIDQIDYEAVFPFTNITFSDDEMPLDITMSTYSPFIPQDVQNSSLPGVYFDFEFTSTCDKPLDVMLVGTIRNLVGSERSDKFFTSEVIQNNDYTFLVQSTGGLPDTLSSVGEMGIGAISTEGISYYGGWDHKHPYYEKLLVSDALSNIDDTPDRNKKNPDGSLIGGMSGQESYQGVKSSVAVSRRLQKGESYAPELFVSWYFPNNHGAIGKSSKNKNQERPSAGYDHNIQLTKHIGHYYQNQFASLEQVNDYLVNNKSLLKSKTENFVNHYYESTVDSQVLDLVNSQLNTLITSSTLTQDGVFTLREGLTAAQAWGPTATSDVLYYASPMVIALFPELQKSSMKAHERLQSDIGEINHGLGFDPDYSQNGTWGVYHRVDLVPNYIQMTIRDYMRTDDQQFLQEMWPSLVLGVDYILKYRDPNADGMPDMHGPSSSYDNFPMFGLSSYVQSQWVNTLYSMAYAAKALGKANDADTYRKKAEVAVKVMEENLWNGSYFSLYDDYKGEKGRDEGILTDQLIGQWYGHHTGLGRYFDQNKISSSLDTIMKASFRNEMFLRNASWPEHPVLFPIEKTDYWVDQANTPWTGVELAFAAFLIYEGKVDEGLKVAKAVESRYKKAGLHWDHQEYGGHYMRPMSAWSILEALAGFSLQNQQYRFAPSLNSDYKLFFTGPKGYGLFVKKGDQIIIEVKSGTLDIKSIQLANDISPLNTKYLARMNGKKELSFGLKVEDGENQYVFKKPITLSAGNSLVIEKRK